MPESKSTQNRPNILFVFTDDQRFDTIAALGNEEIETPNMDRLVKSGTTYTQAHIMGGSAQAVCMPSRAMMLTGRTLYSLDAEGQRIPPEHVTMPEWLKTHGYTTCHVGKWHQDRASHFRSFSTASRVYGFCDAGAYYAANGHWHVPVHDYDPKGMYDPKLTYSDPPVEPFELPFETTKEHGRHSAEFFTDGAIEFIQHHAASAQPTSPFFLYVAHLAPHDPRQYPRRLSKRYTPDRVSLPANFTTQHPFDNGDIFVRDELLEAHPRRPGAVRQHLADYYAIITHLDEQIGRLLDTLDETGLSDNTIIVLAGDNGLAVGQHGLMGKQNLYDHSIRVPLILSGPGIPKDKKSEGLCYLSDIFPTLCDLTGLEVPGTVEGESLAPTLRDHHATVHDVLHFAYRSWQRGVRRDNWKLIEYVVNNRRTTQLFDLAADPLEMHNLARDPSHRETVNALRGELEQWNTEMGDHRECHGKPFWQGYRELPSDPP